MKIHIAFIGLALAFPVVMTVPSAAALEIGTGSGANSSRIYYKLGTGRRVPRPLTRQRNFSFGADADFRWSLGDMCRGTDANLDFAEGVKEEMSLLGGALEDAWLPLLASFGMAKLAELRPAYYDVLSRLYAFSKGGIDIGVKTCEAMFSDAAEGENSIHDVIRVNNRAWISQDIAGGGKSIQEIMRNKGNNRGVAWVGGVPAGGAGNEPIRVTKDVVTAGYNAVHDRAATSNSPAEVAPAGTTAFDLERLFPTPKSAAQWTVDVVGDQEISVVSGGATQGTPGLGLRAKFAQTREEVALRILKLYDDQIKGDARYEDYINASAPGSIITRDLLMTIENEIPEQYEGFFLDKLIEATTFSLVLSRLDAARQLLVSGAQESNVLASGIGDEHIKRKIEALDDQYEAFMRHRRASEMISETALSVYDQLEGLRRQGMSAPKAHHPSRAVVSPATGGVVEER